MKKFLAFLFLVGFVMYRNPPPIRNISPGNHIVDSFPNCTVGSFYAPIKCILRSNSNLMVELIGQEGYNNLTSNQPYIPITTYNLKGEDMMLYHINLTQHYDQINGPCHVVTRNDNEHLIFTEWTYVYPSFWKHILYIISKYGGRDSLIVGYD